MAGSGISQQQLQQAAAALGEGYQNYPTRRQANPYQVNPSVAEPVMPPLGVQFQGQGPGNVYQNMFRQMVANQPVPNVPMPNSYAQAAGMYPYRPPVIGTSQPAANPPATSILANGNQETLLDAVMRLKNR